MTTRMNAHASADRMSGCAEMRVCAVVIARSPCLEPPRLSSRIKPVNTIDSGRRSLHSGVSMSRTPNAAKSIFAFVARISLR